MTTNRTFRLAGCALLSEVPECSAAKPGARYPVVTYSSGCLYAWLTLSYIALWCCWQLKCHAIPRSNLKLSVMASVGRLGLHFAIFTVRQCIDVVVVTTCSRPQLDRYDMMLPLMPEELSTRVWIHLPYASDHYKWRL